MGPSNVPLELFEKVCADIIVFMEVIISSVIFCRSHYAARLGNVEVSEGNIMSLDTLPTSCCISARNHNHLCSRAMSIPV